jgi:peptidoglycan/LPS O-acetylase OafA/YrhL
LARHEIRPLTGLRGIAAMLVAVYHLNGPHEAVSLQVPGIGAALISHGYLAVDLFFVLSGYVMALSYAEMVRRFSWPSYVRFLIRRVARVYPLYIVITLIVALALWSGISHEALGGKVGPTLLWNALMVQSWWGAGISLDSPAWSISAEFAAYVLFPLLAALALFGSRRVAFAVLLVGAAAVVALAFAPLDEPARSGPLDIFLAGYAVVRCLAEFSIGLLTYRLAEHEGARRLFSKGWVALGLSVLLLGLMTFGNSDLLIVAVFPPLVLALAVGTGPVQRLCACPPIFLLGELSYAIYLLHSRMIRFRDLLDAKLAGVAGAAAPALASFIMFMILLGVAWVAYRGLERPARNWVRKAEKFVPARLPDGRPSEGRPAAVPGAAGR